jgi:hypothetical protein
MPMPHAARMHGVVELMRVLKASALPEAGRQTPVFVFVSPPPSSSMALWSMIAATRHSACNGEPGAATAV